MLQHDNTPALYGNEHCPVQLFKTEAQLWWEKQTTFSKLILSSLYNFSGKDSVEQVYSKYLINHTNK